jgi:hypothetical protein
MRGQAVWRGGRIGVGVGRTADGSGAAAVGAGGGDRPSGGAAGRLGRAARMGYRTAAWTETAFVADERGHGGVRARAGAGAVASLLDLLRA